MQHHRRFRRAKGRLKGTKLENGSFLSPDLSYDGKQIVFAYVECEGDKEHRYHTDPSRGHWAVGRSYHIFKVNVDGTGLEQLTDGTGNDFDPCWLPNGRIAFITERRGGYLRCGRVCPTYTLYDMNPDGTEILCLSPHETNEWHPSVTHDGMIVYTRWDYVDRHGCTALPWLTIRRTRCTGDTRKFRAAAYGYGTGYSCDPGSRRLSRQVPRTTVKRSVRWSSSIRESRMTQWAGQTNPPEVDFPETQEARRFMERPGP